MPDVFGATGAANPAVMKTDDQTPVIDFLASPAAHDGATVERIDTHAAIVFLACEQAWKLKRAVRFDYLDFSTAARRMAMCEAEVRLNRRTAPAIYGDVVAVCRESNGTLTLGGPGVPVDWVIRMNRFDQEGLFDRLAARGCLRVELMAPLGRAVAQFHQAAEPRSDHGGKQGLDWVVAGNAAGFADYGAGVLDPSVCARVTADSSAEIERHGPLLDARQSAGQVRQCHGDLHLRNIVLLDGQPTLFDAVEFNDEIACIDVLYDMAFLLMDLWRRELPVHANAVWNGYLADASELEGVALMPLFLSCRAAVRAKTSATAARSQRTSEGIADLQQLARQYLTLAERLLHPPGPCLLAIGGFSGAGKSTLARNVAPSVGPPPGAVVLRSDEIRKRLCGLQPFDHLGPAGYTADVSHRVYATLAERAGQVVRAGHTAIVDAVYSDPANRQAVAMVAAKAAVPFVGVWLDAPERVLVERAEQRRHDASDADAAVIRMQRTGEPGQIEWHRIDAARATDDVLRDTMLHLRRGPDSLVD